MLTARRAAGTKSSTIYKVANKLARYKNRLPRFMNYEYLMTLLIVESVCVDRPCFLPNNMHLDGVPLQITLHVDV